MQPNNKWPEYSSDSRGVNSLILGILGLTTCGILTGLPAWLMARSYLREAEAGTADPKNVNLARIGEVLGMISTALFSVGIVLFLAVIAINAGNRQTNPWGTDDFASPEQIETLLDDMGATDTRHEIAKAIVAEKIKHPKKTYAMLAKELRAAGGGKVSWCPISLAPSPQCGRLTFKTEPGRLILEDDCSSTTLEGWPATRHESPPKKLSSP
jgi:hypothetical protein